MRPFMCGLLLAFSLLSFSAGATTTSESNDYSCSATSPCKVGCCSKTGVCGLGPTFCGAGNCTSSCDQKSECDPGWGSQWSSAEKCPLNVCCSKYGFCGTTTDFCGNKTVKAPTGSGNSSSNRVVGYYEGWSSLRACEGMYPEDIPIEDYTHINYAFALIDPKKFTVAPMSDTDPDLMHRLTDLKAIHTDLKTWISIGGWTMNDADQPTAKTFSTLASSSSAQQSFFKSLLQFMATFGFDGVDIDWEYPVAPERSGRPEDYAGYVSFLRNLKNAFDTSGHSYGISITLPSSYWYMKNFDIVAIEPLVDWFNVMTYDLHGTWDANDAFIGPYVYAHTNLTEIKETMDLLWRNSIQPAKVNMGLGFYGRSFTLTDSNCTAPGCEFKAGATPGPCTQSAGTLSYAEIQSVIESSHATPILDQAAAVKQIVWDSNQWVSYDDEETFKMKVEYANSVGIGGTMVWAASLDTPTGLAANALSNGNGRTAKLLSETTTAPLPLKLSQCVWGECAARDKMTCPSGTSPAQTSRNPGHGNIGIWTGCPKGQQRPFCCPQNNVPTCQWVGSAPWCVHSSCAANEVSIATSLVGSGKSCTTHHKSLCCELTPSDVDWDLCSWKGSAPNCALRANQDTTLSTVTCPPDSVILGGSISGAGGEQSCSLGTGYKSLCCSRPEPWSNCAWQDSGKTYFSWPPEKIDQLGYSASVSLPAGHKCDNSCPAGKVPMAASSSGCYGGTSAYFCCDTPVDGFTSIPPDDPDNCELPLGFINAVGTSFSNVPADVDPTLESPVGFDDCYIPGVPNSGWVPNSGVPPPHDEFRRSLIRRSFFNATNESDASIMDDKDLQDCLEDESCALTLLHYNLLSERGGNGRISKSCRNPPGVLRYSTEALWSSLTYPNAKKIQAAGKAAFWVSTTACNIGTALQRASQIPQEIKIVVEHVFELQSMAKIFQSMTDGVGPGGVVMKTLNWDAWKQIWYSVPPTKYWPGAYGKEWHDIFMGLLGTTRFFDNFLLLDAETNNMKTLIWGGAVNIISSDRWGDANHQERLGLLKYVENVFTYLNTPDAQKALSDTYHSLQSAGDGFSAHLASIGENYDIRDGVSVWMNAQFDFMSAKAHTFFTSGQGNQWLKAEITYWASPKAKAAWGTVDAAKYKAYMSDFQATLKEITTLARSWVER